MNNLLKDLNYLVCTFGCQMNKHDSEWVAGLLDSLGALPVASAAEADIIVYLTCCVREAADVRLKGQVASLKGLSLPASGRRIVAVGGCIGQRDGAALTDDLDNVDVVFGTHNITHLSELLAQALDGKKAVEVLAEPLKEQPHADEGSGPPAYLPLRREQSWHAWLPIMTGCNNFCSYCVVPSVRGPEISRDFSEIVEQARQLVAEGVCEITLLGQNVNSYGRDLYGAPRFAEVLRAVGAEGIRRLRFATSHPKDLSDQTIAAFAEVEAVMPALHLPVQSGSDRILRAMNRNYSVEHYVQLIDKVRAACAQVGKLEPAFSTDLIVGFPGETEADFAQTLQLVKEIGYAQVFTFIYSRREGTPAAKMVDDTAREVIQERFERLVGMVQASAWECNQRERGETLPVLFEGVSKRDAGVLSGRSPRNQTVHVALPQGQAAEEYAGRILPVQIEEARTWYLRGHLA